MEVAPTAALVVNNKQVVIQGGMVVEAARIVEEAINREGKIADMVVATSLVGNWDKVVTEGKGPVLDSLVGS